MIYRISLALLIVVLAIISTVNAFLSHGTGLVRFKAVDSTTRSFLSTSDGQNLQQDDELKGLKDKIAEHERELLTVVDSAERTAIRDQISSCRKDITALRQQGNHLHRYLRPFRYLPMISFAQISFNISSSPIQFRQRRKVSHNGSSQNIALYAVM